MQSPKNAIAVRKDLKNITLYNFFHVNILFLNTIRLSSNLQIYYGFLYLSSEK
jgi:hypothetical protein